MKKALDGRRVQYEAKRKCNYGTVIDILTTISPVIVDGEIVGTPACRST